ncbi:DUF1573 domain-containing protein [Sphingobacterium griseoflavum]|uniref:DUF1573 domain-containing protein n=1 Tax=Sphingobacterium griseoflavum TaxID=1474952 RepID=A0ABQ3I425_9SPHI|nr:DUF1573 domain-containing protein [Sphingobacterium griseoflavum]GHE48623.1 hypothetical protein GCM10017764_34550 [Sphingobacterium griseoflavum]
MNTLKTVFFGFLLATFSACGNAGNSETTTADSTAHDSTGATVGTGEIAFAESAFDFGQVKEGEVVEHVYAFTNTGTSPVILSRVSASCGCTTPSYTQTPILPGKAGEIKVSFDSNGQVGKQQKIVTVVSNAENSVTTIQLRGEVLAK